MNLEGIAKALAAVATIALLVWTLIGLASGELSPFLPVDCPGYENVYIFTIDGEAYLYAPDRESSNVIPAGFEFLYW